MTPIYNCCDKCKHPTYTQCLTSSPSPYWVCPAAGLHCIVDCVAKHDPNRQKITTNIISQKYKPSKFKPSIKKLKCAEIVTENGKKCIKQLCVSLIQPTNGWILVAQNGYATRSPSLFHKDWILIKDFFFLIYILIRLTLVIDINSINL